MAGQGPLGERELARLVGRDVKNIHGYVDALLNAGVLRRNGPGVEFPYDVAHVDFMLDSG